MLERYIEQAQRPLCFARYQARVLGSLTIEPDHLLFGWPIAGSSPGRSTSPQTALRGSELGCFRADARRWDVAERTIMVGGRDRALVDAYRALHGYDRQEFSWILKRRALRVGRQFDHVFCSRGLQILRCEYLHDVRDRGLSDHSALEFDFDWEEPSRRSLVALP